MRAVLSCSGKRCDRGELLMLISAHGLPEALATRCRDNTTKENTSASGRHIADRSLTALSTLKLVAADHSNIVATDAALRLWSNSSQVTAPSFSRALRAQIWQAATAAGDAPSDERV